MTNDTDLEDEAFWPKDPADMPGFIQEQFETLLRNDALVAYCWKKFRFDGSLRPNQILKLIAIAQYRTIRRQHKQILAMNLLQPPKPFSIPLHEMKATP